MLLTLLTPVTQALAQQLAHMVKTLHLRPPQRNDTVS